MSFFAYVLSIAFVAQQDDLPSDPFADFGRHLLTSERFESLQRQASLWCNRSRLPNECQSAHLAASYNSANVRICLERAGEPFANRHVGVATTFAQEEMARTCRSAIQLCRANWRQFFDLSGHEEPVPNERREEIIRRNLNFFCAEEATENAQDR